MLGDNVGVACQGVPVVPVVAERAGIFEWSSGTAIDLTVNVAQVRA